MSTKITIHDVPEAVMAELAQHARYKGQTTQVYLQRKLEGIACTPTLSERLQDAQAFVESFGARVSAEEIVGMIREDRER